MANAVQNQSGSAPTLRAVANHATMAGRPQHDANLDPSDASEGQINDIYSSLSE